MSVSDKLIITLLTNHKIVKRSKIIAKTSKGFGESTIARRLRILEKDKTITLIKNPELYTIYGIKDYDNATYFVLTINSIKGNHYTDVIEALISNNPKIRKNALIEIEDNDIIKLFPYQLTQLSNMTGLSEEECYNCIRIIWKNIESGNYPDKIPEFTSNLLNTLERFKDPNPKNLKEHIISALGFFEREEIITNLKKDLFYLNSETFIRYYSNPYIANIIESHKTELFNFGNQICNKHPNESKLLFQIRNKAKNNLVDDKRKIFKEYNLLVKRLNAKHRGSVI